ncbi:MAG TPA: hemolysin III family protein [Acetobacteraceae bacterium]|jgi:hemolysin III|nr:hemolysin III family protein [Acetobacteraceae bacterium]
MVQAATFPHYTATELALDRALHALALILATVGIAWLLVAAVQNGDTRQFIGLATYGAGLIGMFVASAAYHACGPCRGKELLRRIDHAMIFVMIAGTCTPFALSAFPASIGLLVCALVWIVAVAGAVLKLAFPHQFDRLLLALYLVTGWAIFAISRAFADNLSNVALFLLFGGGLAYSYGAYVQAQARMRFHNATWHGLVLLGAGLHWAAVADQLVNWHGS